MRSRKLYLRKDELADLTSDDLADVVAADMSPTHNGCTLPVNQCALSLDPCHYSSPANCTPPLELPQTMVC